MDRGVSTLEWANKQDPFRLDQAFSRTRWEGRGQIPHTDPSFIDRFIGEVRQAMVQNCRAAKTLWPKI